MFEREVCVHDASPLGVQKSSGYHAATETGNYDPLDMDGRRETWLLCESSIHS